MTTDSSVCLQQMCGEMMQSFDTLEAQVSEQQHAAKQAILARDAAIHGAACQLLGMHVRCRHLLLVSRALQSWVLQSCEECSLGDLPREAPPHHNLAETRSPGERVRREVPQVQEVPQVIVRFDSIEGDLDEMEVRAECGVQLMACSLTAHQQLLQKDILECWKANNRSSSESMDAEELECGAALSPGLGSTPDVFSFSTSRPFRGNASGKENAVQPSPSVLVGSISPVSPRSVSQSPCSVRKALDVSRTPLRPHKSNITEAGDSLAFSSLYRPQDDMCHTGGHSGWQSPSFRRSIRDSPLSQTMLSMDYTPQRPDVLPVSSTPKSRARSPRVPNLSNSYLFNADFQNYQDMIERVENESDLEQEMGEQDVLLAALHNFLA